MKDLKNNIKVMLSIIAAAYTATKNGTGVDLLGFESAVVVFNGGAIDEVNTDETYAYKVQESDDNSNWSDVDAADLEGSLAAVAANAVQSVGYKGSKRYIRPVNTLGGTTPSWTGSAVVVLGHPHHAPVS